MLDGYKGGAKKALENWESARGRYMCANFVGNKCVFQHSMTDSVQMCRRIRPCVLFFSTDLFYWGCFSSWHAGAGLLDAGGGALVVLVAVGGGVGGGGGVVVAAGT